MSRPALSLHPDPAAIPRWQPPLEPDQLRSVLAKMSRWQPMDLDAVYDDLDQILGEQQPEAVTLEDVTCRLRRALEHLGNIADADPAFGSSPETAALVQRGEQLRGQSLPSDYRQALGLSRRIALTTSDLIDRLVQERHIKDDDAT
ncbi:DUF6415 family natural product biosynthesis protein [Streptomyces naganishii]|uniref:DUF6415 family natural product biosynthesis protein n=1 Tax=Streptomyces naganishii TaxID=285447 RepID=UPI0036BC348E